MTGKIPWKLEGAKQFEIARRESKDMYKNRKWARPLKHGDLRQKAKSSVHDAVSAASVITNVNKPLGVSTTAG